MDFWHPTISKPCSFGGRVNFQVFGTKELRAVAIPFLIRQMIGFGM